MRIRTRLSLLATLGLVVACLAMVGYGSRALHSVTVAFVGTGSEHSDKYIPGINSAEGAPDYGVSVRTTTGWQKVGVKSNQFLDAGSLTFVAPFGLSVRQIEEVMLYDDDPVEDDVLEREVFSLGEFQGQNYGFTIVAHWSLLAGLAFFWSTALGKAILLGITMAVVLTLLSWFG